MEFCRCNMIRDVWRLIALNYLTVEEIFTLCMVCKELLQVLSEEYFWKQLWSRDLSDFVFGSKEKYKRLIIKMKKIHRNHSDLDIQIYYAKHGLEKALFARKILDVAFLLVEASANAQWHIVDYIKQNPWRYRDISNITLYSFIAQGAAKGGHMKEFQEMLTLGANDYGAYFSAACAGGQLHILEKVLEINPDTFVGHEYFSISNAVEYGHLNIVKKLISIGVSTELILNRACTFENDEIIDYMLTIEEPKESALTRAIMNKNISLFQKILFAGCKPKGESLIEAIRNYQIPMVKILAEIIKDHTEAIEEATLLGYEDILEFL